jgi:hypothetical protein
LDLDAGDRSLAGLACLPERDYGVDAVRPPSQESVVADRIQATVAGLADDLQATVAVFEGRGRTLRPVASAVRGASLPPLTDATSALSPVEPSGPAITPLAGAPWTLMRLSGSRRAATLAVHGDQSAAGAKLVGAARAVSALLSERNAHRTAHRQAATHALTRRLARVYGFPRMADIVSSATARLLGARVASTAIFDPIAQVLKVHGTYGYPSLLVEHARITPGEGIIGSVFQSGVPLCVPDVRAHDDLFRNRPRYRTNSFIAVPVRAGQRILGVISATDREDNRPFTRDDVSSLRALAAPVALALSRPQSIR